MLGCNTTCVICERWPEQTFLLLWFVVHMRDVARFPGLVFTSSIYVWVCWPCFFIFIHAFPQPTRIFPNPCLRVCELRSCLVLSDGARRFTYD
jgi:hypothetical protein